ncbi:hypothetical protein ACFFU9_08465 [Mariniflexile ostreae]|uniref:RseC/MucC-like positive regulator of sigma(E) n=1 Tax=Mariniflexile ostreae TaxID=1520892 RepID=A0ABV5FBF5_9FLAO
MKIIPSEKIVLKTELSNQEVRKVLAENIQLKKKTLFGFTRLNEEKPFEGVFKHDTFKIQRLIKGRNSFVPTIKGEIQSDFNETKIIVTLNIPKSTLIFIIYWLTFVGFVFIMGLTGMATQGTNAGLLILPLLMGVFAIILTHYGFNSQKEKSINDLKKILDIQGYSTRDKKLKIK